MDISREEARRWLVGATGLRACVPETGAAGARRVLAERRCLQLDPLDLVGTNSDLVVLARVDGLHKSEIWPALYPGHAFEHFAKERCVLPASAFPWYRQQLVTTPWLRLGEHLKRVPPAVLDAVHAEVAERGPLVPSDLEHHGQVDAIDWSGWKGTSKAGTMALEVLSVQCRLVVCGRGNEGKRYDVPERALPQVAAHAPTGEFAMWALGERVQAAGLLSTAGGPHWSMLSEARKAGLAKRAVEAGEVRALTIAGGRRTYLAPLDFGERQFPEDDGRMRILGPLDPLMWDRDLVREVFGFDYVWEVYKPKEQRRWGWYVCPLLHQGQLVGRVEARREKGAIRVDKLWKEDPARFDDAAWAACLERHTGLVC